MALRKKHPSLRIRKALQRHSAMISIDEQSGKTMNYGGEQHPLTEKLFESHIIKCKELLDEYNAILISADSKSKELKAAEEELGEMFTRVLAGGKSIFGINSDEVELLGGTKKSARKKHNKIN